MESVKKADVDICTCGQEDNSLYFPKPTRVGMWCEPNSWSSLKVLGDL